MKKLNYKNVFLISFLLSICNIVIGQTNFIKYNGGIAPVLENADSINVFAEWDATAAADAEVVFYADTFRIWYTSSGVAPFFYDHPRIGYAWSLDGINWTKHVAGPVFEGTAGEWDSVSVETASVLVDTLAPPSERFKMWYVGIDNSIQPMYYAMGYAYSPDGINWTKHTSNPVLLADTAFASFPSVDFFGFEGPSVVFDGTTYHMWYTCIPAYGNNQYWDVSGNIAYASSPDGVNWTKKTDEPVFKVSQTGWDTLFVQTPDVIKIGNTYHMFYSGSITDSTMQTSGGGWHYRVGYAWAPANNIHNWTRYPNPILTNGTPGSWDDASVGLVSIEYINNNLHLWYTGQDSCINDTTCVWPQQTHWDTGYAIDTNTTVGVNGFIFPTSVSIKTYPNPFKYSTIIEFNNVNNEVHTLNIFNIQGKLIRTIDNISGNTIQIERENLSDGLYFYVLQLNSMIIGTGKLIVQQ